MDPITELVCTAIGCGVMIALETPDKLHAAIRAAGPDATLADALRGEAEQFVRTRADLVEAVQA